MDASASGHSAPPARPKKRTGTSKYDFIKVKVWLGEDLDHYYILSRFLICRMLTVTRIPYIKAVKIALETKKHLVDNNMHDVTQAQLEEVLFSIVRAKGFDEAHIDCYRMVTQFYQSRQPLCIIICGAAWTGKSTLAQQLASRINIPNVMQTDVIYELLRAGPDSPLQPTPLWARPGLAGGRCCDAALVREFRREARVVREGMEGDLIKTLSDGKPIIIEGFHLDPGLYIPDFGSRGIIMLPARPSATLAAPGGLRAAVAAGRSPGSSPQGSRDRYRRSQTMPTRAMRSAMSTAAAAAAAAGVAGEPAQQAVESQQADASEQQQQQQPALLFQRRSASANAEVSVSAGGPLSPGSLVTYSNAAADAALEPGLSEQQQVDQQQEQQKQQQQQRLPDGTSREQQVAALPPLPPLRLRKQPQQQHQHQQRQQQEGLGRSNKPNGHVSSSQADCSNGHVHHRITAADAVGTAWPACSLHQSDPCWQHMGTPFADLTAADAVYASDALDEASAAAAAAGCGEVQRGELFNCSREQSVVMFDDVQVCAAAAEAAALHQHHHEQQQHQQQQMLLARPAPGSPFSFASDVSSVGVGGGSPPCISQEHSTTEVVSTVCSCASLGSPALRLSKEPSAAEIWSPANSATGGAAAAAAAAAEGFSSSGVFVSRQLSSGHQMRVTPSPRVSSRQLEQLPEEEPDLVAQQQQQSAGHHLRVNCSPKVSTSQLGQLPEMEQSLVAEQQHEQEQQEQGQRQLLSGCPAPTPSAEQQQQQQQHRGEHGLQTRRHEQPASCPSPATAPASQWDHGEGLPAAAVAPAVEANGTLNAVQQARSLPVKQAGASSAALPATGLQPGQQSQQQQQSSSQQQQSHHQQQQQHGVQQQSQSDSTGLDSSHAAAPQPKSNGSEPAGRPLFVPILVYMDEADQALMAEEALAHLGLPAGKTTELMGLLASSTPEAGADGSSTGVGVLGGGPAADGGSAGSSGSGVGCGYQTRSSSGEGCVHAVGRSEGMQGLVDVQQQQQQDGVSVAEALRRVRLLQEYLCAYEAQGLPVVKVSYGAFGEALDRLHEYVLQCIKVAMQSRQAPV